MPWKINNKLIPIMGIAAILGVIFVVARSCGGSSTLESEMTVVPVSPAPDADSPADTIKTLTANVGELINEVDALRNETARLHEERDDMEANLARQLTSGLREHSKTTSEQSQASQTNVIALEFQIEELTQRLKEIENNPVNQAYPIGGGLTGTPHQRVNLGKTSYVWVSSMDSVSGNTDLTASLHEASLRPLVTIPKNGTLMGSTVMTSLIGRIPRDSSVRDPMPFKVITGSNNLAANGFTIDGIDGMVWSGWAVGDWTLSCVSGHLDSVTYIFEDGTIRTISSGGARSDTESSLGWISDEQGVPCIPGKRVTNARSHLAQQILSQSTTAAAQATSAAETTHSFDSSGSLRSIVSGDLSKYILGEAIAGGTHSSSDWLNRRTSQEFDAIVVAAGHSVAIHVDQELHIDYDRTGRKLNHE